MIGDEFTKMKKMIIFIFSVILTVNVVFPIGVKIVTLPDDIKAEENIFKENFIRNLSELEIYEYFSLHVIDGMIFIVNTNPLEIVKLSLQGEILGRVGKQGEGPGEFLSITGIYEFDGNIALLDYNRRVLLLYSKSLKYIREMRLINPHMDFFVDNNDNFVFYGAGEKDFYFDKYSKDLTHLNSFGHSASSQNDRKKKKLFDDVRCALYVPEDNGIWASFKNRYDIRYYKNQNLTVEIKAKKGFFETKEENFGGRAVVWCKKSRAYCLAKSGRKLFYFFRNNEITFCDIYDTMSFQLLRRIVLNRSHKKISHYKDNIFYSLYRDESKDELQLFKLEL
jgi:hypothetical protein